MPMLSIQRYLSQPEHDSAAAQAGLEDLLRARITAILQLVQLEVDGAPIEPTGFRLYPEGAKTCGE